MYYKNSGSGRIVLHPRVFKRHPELDETGVLAAWLGAIASTPRVGKERDEYIAVGFDDKGRLLEVVAARTEEATWVIFHAMTPPSEKTMTELGISGGRTR